MEKLPSITAYLGGLGELCLQNSLIYMIYQIEHARYPEHEEKHVQKHG